MTKSHTDTLMEEKKQDIQTHITLNTCISIFFCPQSLNMDDTFRLDWIFVFVQNMDNYASDLHKFARKD